MRYPNTTPSPSYSVTKLQLLNNLLGSLDQSTRRFQRVDNILCRWVMHRKWEILLPNFINLKMNTMSIIAHMDV